MRTRGMCVSERERRERVRVRESVGGIARMSMDE